MISNDKWPLIKLNECCEYISRGKQPKYVEMSEVKTLNQKAIQWGNIDKNALKYHNPEISVAEKHFILKGDIVLNSTGTGTVGRCYYFSEEPTENMFADSHVTIIRTKPELLLPAFLYYQLSTNQYQSMINNSFLAGSTGQVELNKSKVQEFPIYTPSIKIQENIVKILKVIDEKIKNNQLTIKNLEQLSQTLFKQWFIDFEFPNEEGKPYKSSGGEMVESELKEIPKGWNLSVINDIAYQKKYKVNLDKTSNEFNYIGLEHMPQGNIALGNWEGSNKVSGNKNLFKKDDILFGKLRPYFKKVGIAPIEGVCSTDIIVINSEEAHLKSYLFLNLIQDDFIQYTSNTATGTRMPRTSWEIMSNYKIVLPDEHILVKFEEAISPILQKVNSIIHENKNLTQLRDTLLPKLLSGEIEIPDDLEV